MRTIAARYAETFCEQSMRRHTLQKRINTACTISSQFGVDPKTRFAKASIARRRGSVSAPDFLQEMSSSVSSTFIAEFYFKERKPRQYLTDRNRPKKAEKDRNYFTQAHHPRFLRDSTEKPKPRTTRLKSSKSAFDSKNAALLVPRIKSAVLRYWARFLRGFCFGITRIAHTRSPLRKNCSEPPRKGSTAKRRNSSRLNFGII